MKKLLIAILIGLGLGSGVFFITKDTPPQNTQTRTTDDQTQTEETPTPQTSHVISNPQTIKIPLLGVETVIEHVGLDSEKRMDVPKDYANVAWYELGFAPGETGSAVIAGHFDTPQGTEGVFYDIGNLQNGDEIIVEGNNTSLTYSVVGTETYEFDQVPLQEVFNSKDQKRLNLITCDGVFDQTSQNYSDRLIVYTVLTE